MRSAGWMLSAVMLPAFAGCTGRQDANQKPAQPNFTRAADSSKADLAVPLCPAKFNDSLETDGIAAAGDKGVTLPVVRHSTEAELSPEVKRKTKKKGVPDFEGTSLIGIVVDEHGNPQSLCLVRSVGCGLDANAADAVRQYKFDPATKNGKPVPYRLTIEVDFWRY